MTEHELKEEICEIGRLMYQKGYICGGEGNISCWIDGEDDGGVILVTPSGLHKGFLRPEQILAVNLDGVHLHQGETDSDHLKVTSELPMHLEAYRRRSDIRAVIHAHPPHAIALSIAEIPIADDLIPEVTVFLGRIPTTPYATPSSSENADAIRAVISEYDALVLQRHGSLTVGRSLMDAFMRLETVENSAKIAYMLAVLGVDSPISAGDLAKLQHQRAILLSSLS